ISDEGPPPTNSVGLARLVLMPVSESSAVSIPTGDDGGAGADGMSVRDCLCGVGSDLFASASLFK
ncbi:hypothetical protein OAF30_04930, partial [Flavobacteriales bacterium]|nr:hypothetical protein [Flavobacteriales bacterium]